MVVPEDDLELEMASELIRNVMERHRGEDLRVLSLLNSAIQDIRVGVRYLHAETAPLTAPR